MRKNRHDMQIMSPPACKHSRLPVPSLPEYFLRIPVSLKVAEILLLYLFKAEYFLSPDGRLRRWLRLHLFLSVVLGIPAVLLLPVLLGISGAVASIALSLEIATRALLMAILYLFGTALLLLTGFGVLKHFNNKD